MTIKLSPNLKRFLQYSLIAIALLLIIRHFMGNTHDFLLIKNISIQTFFLVALLIMAYFICSAEKILAIFKNLGLKTIKRMQWFRILMISAFAGYHISQGATIYRSIHLKKLFNFSYTDTLSATAITVWLDTLVVLSFTIASLILSTSTFIQRNTLLLTLCIVFLTIVMIPVFLKLIQKITKRFTFQNKFFIWATERTTHLANNVIARSYNGPLAIQFTFFSLISFILHIVIFYLLLQSLFPHTFHREIPLFTAIFFLSRSINIVPGNIGIGELICGYASELLWGNRAAGYILSALYRIISYLVCACFGIIFSKHIFIRKTDLEKIT